MSSSASAGGEDATGALAGQTLGRYRLGERLGAGGMGVVYHAHDQLLRRDVAVKILRDQDAAGRLLREARSASALNHPNICTVHEVGEHDGRSFIVMEYVEGEPLSARVERGALPPAEVIRVGDQLADALAHAHGRGVIHRDLKCSNAVVSREGRVKVLDFGIAVRPSSAEVDTVTGPATDSDLTGTVAYMAPEILRGEPADPQSEMWSLGVMLYELAAGRRPFRGETTFALVASIAAGDPDPLPATVPPPLAGIIQRCLTRNRHERYQSARELKAALDASHQALSSGRFFLSDAVGRRIASIAVLPLANRCSDPGQDFFVDGMTDALIVELARLKALRVISRTSVMRYRDTAKTVPEIAAELGVDALVEGAVMSARGVIRVQAQLIDAAADRSLWSQSYDRPADDVLSLHSNVARAVAEEIRARIATAEPARMQLQRTVNPRAHELWLRGRYLQNKTVWTPDDYMQALQYYQQSGEADPTYAPAFVGQADLSHRLGGYGFWPPAKAFAQAKVAAERAVALDPGLSEAHAAVGFSRWQNDWNYPASLLAYEQALALGNQTTLHQHGSLLSLMGRHEEGVAVYLQAVSVNPFSSEVHWGLGMVYRQGGWFDRSIEALRAWLAVEPNDTQATFQLAYTFMVMGRHEEAASILEGIAAVPQVRALALGPLAYARGRNGRRAEAQQALDELIAIAAAGYFVHGWVALGFMGLGDHEKALDALQASVDAHESWMPTHLKVEPTFAPLHGHPRFQALLEVTGLAS